MKSEKIIQINAYISIYVTLDKLSTIFNVIFGSFNGVFIYLLCHINIYRKYIYIYI